MARLSDADVADALTAIRTRLLRVLAHRGVVEVDDGLTVVGDTLANGTPPPPHLAAPAASGLPPAGPEARRRSVGGLPPPGRVVLWHRPCRARPLRFPAWESPQICEMVRLLAARLRESEGILSGKNRRELLARVARTSAAGGEIAVTGPGAKFAGRMGHWTCTTC